MGRMDVACTSCVVLMGLETDLVVLREGCFRYFQLGGECVAGPVGFLSV